MENLESETSYAGTIEANDGNGGMSSSNYTFTTLAAENQDPGSFTVTVNAISENGATLSWSTSEDPDGDNVTYVIRMAGDLIAENISETTYTLDALTASTTYNGRVIAEDGNGGRNGK